jgi:hypothetical protein
MAAFMPLLALGNSDEKTHDMVDDPATGAAMLTAAPLRPKVLSARATTTANRVLATAMLMLAAAIASTNSNTGSALMILD